MSKNFSVRECEIGLNMVSGIGKKRYLSLIEHFGDAKSVFEASVNEISGVNDIGKVTAKALTEFELVRELEVELEAMEKHNISTCHLYDENYPRNLKKIFDPPPLLYIKGEVKEEDDIALAVIGTRVPTHYGLVVTEKLVKELLPYGFTIVSGLARGIDSQAHKITLKNGGRTIAVLGSGLLNIYPPENKKLAEAVSENGALISEFNLFRKPDKNNFPSRNRIVAGLSSGTLVIEAPEKSGSLITAELAIDYGRDVFAVPGQINSPKSRGSHKLIKNGAKLVEKVEDIIEEFPLLENELNKPAEKKESGNSGLKEIEKRVLGVINERPLHIDKIALDSGIPISELSEILLQLEMIEKIKNIGGHFYILEF